MNCIFCQIVAGDIPCKKVFENDDVMAFLDIAPSARVHVLLIPKKHVTSVAALQPSDFAVIGSIHQAAQQVARDLGVEQTGYRLITNTGPDSGQEVFHLHYHLLGGENLGPLLARQ